MSLGEVNMADVASRAQVSIATVSRALRGLPGVSEATRRRVLDVAEELSYVVSPAASSLSRRATGRVAVVVRRVDTWFYATMLASIAEALHTAGIDVLVYQLDDEGLRDRFFRDLPARRKVDAVVLVALPLHREEQDRLRLLGVEVVVAGGRLHPHPHVEVDDHAIATAAVDHLLALGHERIGLIRTLDTTGAAWAADVLRLAGYRDALARADVTVPEDLVVSEEYDAAAGRRGMARLLALAEPPTAVFCYSDEIAVGAVAELTARGLRAPDDVSLVGVDGHPTAELFGLSTFDQQVAEQGRLAGALAVRLLSGEELERSSVEVSWRFVDRGSTGPPRA